MSEAKRKDCGEHRDCQPVLACQHLANGGTGLGFNLSSSSDDSDRLWPDAWCDDCERVLVAEGEWNEEALDYADFHLLCDAHYDHARRANWRQDDRAFCALVERAMAYLQQRQDELVKRFRLGEHERYSWNQDTGDLVFSTAGKARVVADFLFIGSHSREGVSWMWSWANQSLEESVKHALRRVRSYGEAHGYWKLVSGMWCGREEEAWCQGNVGNQRVPLGCQGRLPISA